MACLAAGATPNALSNSVFHAPRMRAMSVARMAPSGGLVKRYRPALAAVELALGTAADRQRLLAVVMTFVTIRAAPKTKP